MAQLTTTSYAILGLLAIKPWTTYELAKQMEVSLRNFWPRAESKLYEEPKKLVAHGYARVTHDAVGRRPRAVYTITPKGRRALRRWLGEPAAMHSLEFEALVKVFFAEQGTRDQLRRTLERILAGARQQVAIDARWARRYLEGGAEFPRRLAVLSVVGRLQADLNHTILQWATWALDTVEDWPDDPASASPRWDSLEEIVRRDPTLGDRRVDLRRPVGRE